MVIITTGFGIYYIIFRFKSGDFLLQRKMQFFFFTFKPEDDRTNMETRRNDNQMTLISNEISTREEKRIILIERFSAKNLFSQRKMVLLRKWPLNSLGVIKIIPIFSERNERCIEWYYRRAL